MKVYYVYILARPDGVPFYVGKGTGKRWTCGGNCWAKRVARKINGAGGSVKALTLPAKDEEHAFRMEMALIESYGRSDLGSGFLCNLTGGGEGSSGLIFSAELRARMSAAKTGKGNPMFGRRGPENPTYGRKASAETRKKLSDSQRRRFSEQGVSDQTRAKISAAGTGKKLNRRQRAALAASNKGKWKGRKHGEETKAKISAAVSGEKHGMYGKKHTPEARRKISEGLSGRPCSAETRAKISAKRKAYFARLRATGDGKQ